MASMFRITSNAKEYLADLARLPRAMQAVTAQTLTDTAQAVTTRSERNIKREMIVRTTYTTKSLRTFKASASRPIPKQDAVSGTVSDYLPIQDEGGTVKAQGKKIPIPTNAVRGKNRRKVVPSRLRMKNAGEIQWTRPYAKGARFFALYPTTADHMDESKWYAKKTKRGRYRKYETFGRNKRNNRSAYRLSRPAIFTRMGGKLVKVRDVSLSVVKVRARRWHNEAVKQYGNYAFMARRFQVNAHRFLKDWRPVE